MAPLQLTKEQRVHFIDNLEQRCNTMVFSRNCLGILSRSFHLGTPWVILLVLLTGPRWMVNMASLGLMLCIALFYIFNGCFLSMLEKRLCHDDFTIADPFMELLRLDSSHENRLLVTYMVVASYLVFFYTVYYVRFF